MKLVQLRGKKFLFELGNSEKSLLFEILRMYPVVPAAHHQLTQGEPIPRSAEAQRLLDEALQSHREENRRQVLELLNEPGRFAVCPAGYRVSFNRGEIEWLLQVLNDLRIGSWLALGSPGLGRGTQTQPNLDPETTTRMMTMEVSGFFEMGFLESLRSGRSSGPQAE